MKNLTIILITLAALSGCITEPKVTTNPLPESPFVVQTDIESCVRDPLQPWCQQECKLSIRSWCQ